MDHERRDRARPAPEDNGPPEAGIAAGGEADTLDIIDTASAQSFPASDPPSWASGQASPAEDAPPAEDDAAPAQSP